MLVYTFLNSYGKRNKGGRVSLSLGGTSLAMVRLAKRNQREGRFLTDLISTNVKLSSVLTSVVNHAVTV